MLYQFFLLRDKGHVDGFGERLAHSRRPKAI